MAIRAVGFDYLGVVAQLPDRDVFQMVADALGRNRDDVFAAYYEHNAAFQRNELTERELWTVVASAVGAKDKADAAYTAATRDLPVADEAVLKLIDDVRAAGYKTGLLSNLASGTDWDADMKQQGVPGHFDAVVLSGDIGFAKPDPRAFRALAQRLGVDTSELVFIDDRQASLMGVEAIGVTPVVYAGLSELIVALQRIGITDDRVGRG